MTERQHVTIRLSEQGLAAVDAIAKEEGRSRSDVIRRLLSEALAVRHKAAARHGQVQVHVHPVEPGGGGAGSGGFPPQVIAEVVREHDRRTGRSKW